MYESQEFTGNATENKDEQSKSRNFITPVVPRQAKGHIRFKIPKHLGDNTFLTYILQLHVTHHVKMEDALIIQPIQRNVIVRLDGKGAFATKRMEVSKRQLKSN